MFTIFFGNWTWFASAVLTPRLYRPVTTSLVIDDELVHVGYAEEREDLFLLALPATKGHTCEKRRRMVGTRKTSSTFT